MMGTGKSMETRPGGRLALVKAERHYWPKPEVINASYVPPKVVRMG